MFETEMTFKKQVQANIDHEKEDSEIAKMVTEQQTEKLRHEENLNESERQQSVVS